MKPFEKMTAREKDLYIASELMGWRVDYDSYTKWYDMDSIDLEDLVLTAPGDTFHGERSLDEVPYYSKDLSEVVKAEKKLSGTLKKYYEMNILTIYKKHRATIYDMLQVPPMVRANALVKTLQEGKVYGLL